MDANPSYEECPTAVTWASRSGEPASPPWSSGRATSALRTRPTSTCRSTTWSPAAVLSPSRCCGTAGRSRQRCRELQQSVREPLRPLERHHVAADQLLDDDVG